MICECQNKRLLWVNNGLSVLCAIHGSYRIQGKAQKQGDNVVLNDNIKLKLKDIYDNNFIIHKRYQAEIV